MLHLGNCTVTGSAPVIIFGKNNGAGGYRNAFMGYTSSFFLLLEIMEIQIQGLIH